MADTGIRTTTPDMDPSVERWLTGMGDVLNQIVRWRKWEFSAADRDEALQRIRMSLWKLCDQRNVTSLEEPLVRSVAVRRCIDVVRIRSRDWKRLRSTQRGDESAQAGQEMEFEEEGLIGNPLALIDRVDRAREVGKLLRHLTAVCQDALTRFYVEEQSYQEIARDLAITVNTVGSRLSKCLEKMRVLMRNHPMFEEDFTRGER